MSSSKSTSANSTPQERTDIAIALVVTALFGVFIAYLIQPSFSDSSANQQMSTSESVEEVPTPKKTGLLTSVEAIENRNIANVQTKKDTSWKKINSAATNAHLYHQNRFQR